MRQKEIPMSLGRCEIEISLKMSAKILIIDDGEFERRLLQSFLTREGFEVLLLSSGAGALEIIERSKPGLVLCDVMMPDIGGREVLGQIRARYSAIELPVIMITGKTETKDVVESLQNGANDHISKPLNPQIILHRVRTQLAFVELARQTSQLKEMQAIHAMITTYNHEINNPLAVAIGTVDSFVEKSGMTDEAERLRRALLRISDIVKKIDAASARDVVDYERYAQDGKMVRIK